MKEDCNWQSWTKKFDSYLTMGCKPSDAFLFVASSALMDGYEKEDFESTVEFLNELVKIQNGMHPPTECVCGGNCFNNE